MAQNNDSPGKRLKREEAKNVSFGFMRPEISPLNQQQFLNVALGNQPGYQGQATLEQLKERMRNVPIEQRKASGKAQGPVPFKAIRFGQKPGSIGEAIGKVLTLGEEPMPGQGFSITPAETAEQTGLNLVAGEAIAKGLGLAAKSPAVKRAGKDIYELYLKKAPWTYKGTPEMMYRGIGKEGMEDAIKSGVFRSKQNVVPIYFEGTPFQMNKSFGIKPYFTPQFKTAASYGSDYIAEVPRTAANWTRRYGRKDWSQIADRPIPIEEGRILQKDFWRGYKPMAPKK